MANQIKIDRELCIGSARCCTAAPRVFALDDAELAVVIDGSDSSEEELVYAAKQCPTGAITVLKDGKDVVNPK